MTYVPNTDLRHRAKTLKLSIAAIVAVMVVAMWAAVAVSIHASRESAINDMQANAANLAFAFDDEVTHTLDTVASTMEALANRMRAEGSDMNIYEWAREIPIRTGPIIEGGIIAPNGTVISSTESPDLKPIDVSDRDYFQIQLDGKFKGPFIGVPIKSRVSNKILIPISERVETTDGRFVGVLIIVLSPAQLTTLYKSINLGKDGTITMIGMDDIIRARFSLKSPEGLDGIGQPIVNGLGRGFDPEKSQGTYILQSSIDHITRLYSYRRIQNYPLIVSVGLGSDEGLSLSRANAKTISVLAAIATLLLGGAALYLVREIDRRVVRDIELAEKSERLQAANTELTSERGKLQVVNTELIESKKRAEVANQAKSLFLANMGHEFRTPLNAIIGFSEVIKDQIVGPIGKPIYAEYAKDIWGAGKHLLEIINNLLDISKIEAGKTELSEELIDPSEIVGASLAAMRIQAENRKITLIADISSGTPFIRGDALRLRQVLINLVSNAVKFTEVGNITVSAAFDAVRGYRFTVADTGIGMSSGEIVVAMEPFGQVDNAITKKYEGTGLGLPLAQRLVELHGGRLEIESVKGVGTTVSVYLPLNRVVRSVPEVAA